jgi:xylulokinase
VRRGTSEFESGENSAAQVRALLEGQFLNMKHHTDWIGIAADRILLTGGASRNDGIAQVAADVFGAPVERLAIANSAALGAAILAAVTDGGSMADLQATFCQTSAGSRLAPQPNADYSTTMSKFVDLLEA